MHTQTLLVTIYIQVTLHLHIRLMTHWINDWICIQWRIQKFFGNTVFSRGFWSEQEPKRTQLWTLKNYFSYKHVWTAWVGLIYYGKCSYYVFTNRIRHCVWREFIQNYFKIFNFYKFGVKVWDPIPVDW